MQQAPSGAPHYSPPLHNVVPHTDDSSSAATDSQTAQPSGPTQASVPGSSSGAGHGAAERLPSEDPLFPHAVKISQSSKIPAVAGKIAHLLRAQEWPTLLVAGNCSIHTAIKCCITAGRFVQQEGLSIIFDPLFRDADHSRALLALQVLPVQPGAARGTPAAAGCPGSSGGRAAGVPVVGPVPAAAAAAAALGLPPLTSELTPPVEIKVSVHSRHAKVGAAISARLAEDPTRAVVLLALGETAVANAVMATAHAGHYLAAQGGLRLAVQALTATIVKEGEQLTGVQLWVGLQRAGTDAARGGALLGGSLAGGALGASF